MFNAIVITNEYVLDCISRTGTNFKLHQWRCQPKTLLRRVSTEKSRDRHYQYAHRSLFHPPLHSKNMNTNDVLTTPYGSVKTANKALKRFIAKNPTKLKAGYEYVVRPVIFHCGIVDHYGISMQKIVEIKF